MKELDYGKNYLYPHNYPSNFVEQDYMPDETRGRKFWEPQQNASEIKHLEFLEKRWGKK